MKRMTTSAAGVMIGITAIGLVAIFPTISWAHCDTLDGPVVADAKTALEKRDVTPVLKWVKTENEDEIKAAFKKTLAARAQGKEAQEIADLYFFETLVRVHRAGEGAAFTGLKPAGFIEPPVAAADHAIEVGSADDLAKEFGRAAEKAVRDRFGRLTSAKKHMDESVAAGREYVEAYVEYVHFVEGLHNTITAADAHHEHVN